MTTLFDAPPLTWAQRDALKHAEYWDDMAREQVNSPRGRQLAAECREAAKRLRKEVADAIDETLED